VTEGYRVLSIGSVEPLMVVDGTLAWLPLRRTLGVRAFGINAYMAAEAGQDVVEEHTEEGLGHEELYLVLSGEAKFTVDSDTHDVSAGSLVYVADPRLRRHATATVPNTTVLAIGGKPGEAFTPSAWEHYFAADAVARGGDLDRAYQLTMAGLQEYPGNGMLLYDAACYSALAGRADKAIEHLREAYRADPENVRARAERDSDMDSLRNRPDWPM
jgi:quercetin dioxygenase-like cupin family protein